MQRKEQKESGDEINLIELLLYLWEKRLVISAIIGGFLILGLLVSTLSRVEYQASATLMPENESQDRASNLLRQYGGMLGISSGVSNGDGISTNRYPDIIASTPYQVELMNVPVRFSTLDTTMTPHEYFSDIFEPSYFSYIEKYTIGLPKQILKLFKSSETDTVSGPPFYTSIDTDSVITLSGGQRSTIGKLSSRLTILQEGGLITLNAEFPDPRAAAEIGQAGMNLLKEYVREYKTQKANDKLEFVRKQTEEAEKRFRQAQKELAEFRDSNVNIATARAQTKEQQLQSQYNLTEDIYNSLRQNLEQSKLSVQENTPVFTTLEPFQIPTSNSKPNTELIILMFTFLGVITGVGYVLAQWQWKKFKEHTTG